MSVNIASGMVSWSCFKRIADGEIKRAGFALHDKGWANRSLREEQVQTAAL